MGRGLLPGLEEFGEGRFPGPAPSLIEQVRDEPDTLPFSQGGFYMPSVTQVGKSRPGELPLLTPTAPKSHVGGRPWALNIQVCNVLPPLQGRCWLLNGLVLGVFEPPSGEWQTHGFYPDPIMSSMCGMNELSCVSPICRPPSSLILRFFHSWPGLPLRRLTPLPTTRKPAYTLRMSSSGKCHTS